VNVTNGRVSFSSGATLKDFVGQGVSVEVQLQEAMAYTIGFNGAGANETHPTL
jgi:hypothetical protein